MIFVLISKMLYIGTVPMNKILFVGTIKGVPMNKMPLIGTTPINKIWNVERIWV